MMLSLQLAADRDLAWCQEQVTQYHYLKKPVDVRGSILAYMVLYGSIRVGVLMFARPECTKVNGWYGSIEDVERGRCRITRWQVLNLCRVWLDPCIQHDGPWYVPNAASLLIAQALRRVPYEYLVAHPPVFLEEPYRMVECLSYCQPQYHQGTIYKASNFQLVRTGKKGIQTYARSLRSLSHAEIANIRQRSQEDKRCQHLRAKRAQLSLFEMEVA